MFRFVVLLLTITCSHGLPSDLLLKAGLSERIIGGTNAELGQFPYQAELELNGGHQCGGTILNNRWVVTAAHCVFGLTANSFILRLGTTTLDHGGDLYKLDKIIVHSGYNMENIQNDIALVRSSTEIEFKATIQPLPLADYEVDDVTDVVVSGWGYISWPPIGTPNDLKFVNLRTISNTNCALRMILVNTVTENQICTLTKSGEGVCGGDSGGPLVHNGHLVGIVSWGIPCGKGYPDVYTKVAANVDWIKNNMN